MVGALIFVGACRGSAAPTMFDDFGTFNGARVEVLATGGFAGRSIADRVSHDDRAYMHTGTDTATGTLAATTTDSLFNIVLGQARGLKDDYGLTANAADMFTYTVRITTPSGTKASHADDGTMPLQLRAIVEAVRGTISAARK
jgi:hypothetical protein